LGYLFLCDICSHYTPIGIIKTEMKKLTLLLVATFALASVSHAQGSIAPSDDFARGQYRVTINSLENIGSNADGSPLWFEDWVNGTLIMADSTVMNSRTMVYQFDAVKNEIFAKMTNQQIVALYSNNISQLILQVPNEPLQTMVLKKYRVGRNDAIADFVQVLYESPKFVFINDLKKTLRKANSGDQAAMLASSGSQRDRYEDDSNYFLKIGNQAFSKISSLRVNNFIEWANKKQRADIEAFCVKEQLKGKLSVAQITKLLAFLESL
jgi:hypothetical protein